MKVFITVFVLLAFQTSFCQFTTTVTNTYAKNVGDSFEIYISLPSSYTATQKYNVVYYCDANLNSGRLLRELIANKAYNEALSNQIFVGIGHTGNYHVLRRRDFILPSIRGGDTIEKDKNYGLPRKFYTYLKEELMPDINTRFNTNKDSNSLIGHSLGGLFCFFCLFQSEAIFSEYFALSPALWIDRYAIYNFNKISGSLPRKQYLYFAAGTRETVNKILHGTNEMKAFLDKMAYPGLEYEYDVISGKTHNTEVPVTLDKILSRKL